MSSNGDRSDWRRYLEQRRRDGFRRALRWGALSGFVASIVVDWLTWPVPWWVYAEQAAVVGGAFVLSFVLWRTK